MNHALRHAIRSRSSLQLGAALVSIPNPIEELMSPPSSAPKISRWRVDRGPPPPGRVTPAAASEKQKWTRSGRLLSAFPSGFEGKADSNRAAEDPLLPSSRFPSEGRMTLGEPTSLSTFFSASGRNGELWAVPLRAHGHGDWSPAAGTMTCLLAAGHRPCRGRPVPGEPHKGGHSEWTPLTPDTRRQPASDKGSRPINPGGIGRPLAANHVTRRATSHAQAVFQERRGHRSLGFSQAPPTPLPPRSPSWPRSPQAQPTSTPLGPPSTVLDDSTWPYLHLFFESGSPGHAPCRRPEFSVQGPATLGSLMVLMNTTYPPVGIGTIKSHPWAHPQNLDMPAPGPHTRRQAHGSADRRGHRFGEPHTHTRPGRPRRPGGTQGCTLIRVSSGLTWKPSRADASPPRVTGTRGGRLSPGAAPRGCRNRTRSGGDPAR
jgi:hypothetical protein